ncbi:MAG: fatty acid desaturase family protein [Myxococcales bacterium]|nr:fatty acid desaturase family protein [Myxococcales bacterium]
MSAAAPTHWRDVLSRQEIDELLCLHDARSWFSIAFNWGVVGACFAWVAVWPNPFSIVAALFLIGARQLGFAVLMHEAAHRSLLSNKRVNDRVGNWLCGYPIWSDLDRYRPYHLKHHARTGGEQDPDLGLITPFPITRASLRRKVWRDLTGQTGLKIGRASWARSFGRSAEDPAARRAARGFWISNAVLFGLLALAGHPALYLLWVLAWLTTNQLVTRIRSIAEHALTPDVPEPEGLTRTTLPRWWERLLIAPNCVNYHLEHHLLITVPHYHLRRMHRLLDERGILTHACIDVGYPGVLRRAASRPAGGGAAPSYRPPPRVPSD